MKMDQTESLDPEADQEVFPDINSYTWEDFKRQRNEVFEKLDEVSKRLDAVILEYESWDRELDNVRLELERKYHDQKRLMEELDGIFSSSLTDQNEDVDASTNDREDAVWRSLDALDLEISQLHLEEENIKRRLDAVSLERNRLDQEEAEWNQKDAELNMVWQDLMDDEEDVEPSTDEDLNIDTDEDDSTDGLDDEMFLALSKMVSSLCSICRNLAKGRAECLVKWHHPSLTSLKKSVDAGCRLCLDVAESLDEFCNKLDPPETKQEFWSLKCNIFGCDGRLHIAFHLCRCETDHSADAHCEHKLLRTMRFYPARKLSLGPEFLDPTVLTSSANSAASLSVARSWYQQCLSHTTCRNWKQETRVLPTRLIQICRPDSNSPVLSARIHETKYLPTSTPYATLSHCWGKGVIFRLLKENLKDLSVSIPISQLPKVFQDAIHVSYEVGISYLWIDSLCIIQDSKEDWTHEAKRMGDVYLHGEFNISATGYGDGLSGLFSERKALTRVNLPLCADFVHIDEDLKKRTAYRGIFIRVNQDDFFEQIIASPLFERAWVAQERVLSPAIIHYTPSQIWWECNQGISSEAITGSPYVDGELLWYKAEDTGRCRIRSLSTQSKREEVYAFWNNFLFSYSHCVMTFNRDRFPAVAGIARILNELIDDDFVAGFWSGDLIRSLLLSRLPLRASIQNEQLAPSWSWASSTAGIDRIPDETVDLSQLTLLDGVRIIRILSDIPGFKSDLESASFEKSGVRGLVIKGVLRRLPTDSDPTPSWIKSAHMSYDNKEPCKFRGKDNIPEDQKWRLQDPTHMLLLAKVRNKGEPVRISVYGILLQVAEDAEAFRRSGQISLVFKRQTWEECFGPSEKDVDHQSTFGATVQGLQEIMLI